MPAPRSSDPVESVEVHDLASLPRARLDDWLALFAARGDAGFQHHPDWFRAIDAHLPIGGIRVGVARDAGGPLALLTLAGAPGAREAHHPRHAHLALGDVLLHPRLDGAAGRRTIGSMLRTMAPRADVWRIADVPEDAALLRAPCPERADGGEDGVPDGGSRNPEAPRPASPDGWARRPSRRSMRFDLGPDAYAVPGKLRRNLARLRRRLAAEGELRVERVRGPDALDDAWDRFLEVEASGWKGSGDAPTAIRDDPTSRGFYGALLDPTEPGLAPVIDLLLLDGHCIAAQLGLEVRGTLSLLKIGYDERHAACAPGALLLEDALERTRAEGSHTLSLVTAPPWAERWHPEVRQLWHAVRYEDSIGGRGRQAIDRLARVARSRLGDRASGNR